MNYEAELKELIKLGMKLRTSQKKYFEGRQGPDRINLLNSAKGWEKAFDSKLQQLHDDFINPHLPF
jgi:hypothetical protein